MLEVLVAVGSLVIVLARSLILEEIKAWPIRRARKMLKNDPCLEEVIATLEAETTLSRYRYVFFSIRRVAAPERRLKLKFDFESVFDYFHYSGYQEEALNVADAILDLTVDADGRRSVLTRKGWALKQMDRLDDAEACYREALAIAVDLDNQKGIASAYGNIGQIYRLRGNHSKARKWYEKSLKIERTIKNNAGIAADLGNIAALHFYEGNHQYAEKLHLEALNLAIELEEPYLIRPQLNGLAMVYIKTDRPNDASKCLDSAQESSTLHRELLETKSEEALQELMANISNI